MSQDTDNLEREAEARRSTLNSTIDELRSRMSVGQIVDEVTDYFGKGQTNAAAQNLGRQVRDNPLALGLVGAGLAWLFLGKGVHADAPRHDLDRRDEAWRGEAVRASPVYSGDSGLSGTRDHDSSKPGLTERAGSAASGAADRISGGASAASSTLSDAAGRAGSAAASAGRAARGYGEDAASAAWSAEQAVVHGAQSAGQGAYRMGRNAGRSIRDTLQEEPLIFGAIAVAVGAAIGASLPSSQIEDEYLGETGDRLREGAYEYGRNAFDSAKDVASETYKAASAEADRQGLKPSGDGDTLAEKVSNVVGAATSTAKDQAKKDGLV